MNFKLNWVGQKGSYIYFMIILIMIFGSSCNDDLNIDIPEPDDKIVIDGWIEQNKKATVFLTANSPYFSAIDSASLRDLVLTRAKVTIDDGKDTEILILRKNEIYFPPFFYQSNRITGEIGNTYTITAEYGGRIAWATTIITEPVDIDTVFFELAAGEDSLGVIQIEFTDPGEVKNFYRILTKREGIDDKFTSTLAMAFDDKYFPGRKAEFTLFRAPSSYIIEGEGDNYYRLGDTVVIKLCTISKEHFEFWNSYQEEILNVANPFAASLTEVVSNVEGDGLGVWGGYGATYDTVYTLR